MREKLWTVSANLDLAIESVDELALHPASFAAWQESHPIPRKVLHVQAITAALQQEIDQLRELLYKG
jgi:hypothetical protein